MSSMRDVFPDSSEGDLVSEPDRREALARDVERVFGPIEANSPASPTTQISAASIAQVFTRPVQVVRTDESAGPAVPPPRPAREIRPAKRAVTPLKRWIIGGSAVLAASALVVGAVVVIADVRERQELQAAQQLLATSEADLTAARESAEQSASEVASVTAAGLARATEMEQTLESLTGYVDEPARVAALAAVNTYRAGLTALVPADLAVAESTAAHPASLDDVTEAVSEARAATTTANNADKESTAAKQTVADLDAAFTAAIATFGATIPASTEAEIASAPDAVETLRSAVTAAVSAITAAQSAGDLGVAQLQALPAAIDAMRADQVANERAETPRSPTTPRGSVRPQPSTPTVPDPTVPDESTPTPDETGSTPEPEPPTSGDTSDTSEGAASRLGSTESAPG